MDKDDLPNYLDLDSDGDGLLDSLEGARDPDGDKLPNFLDLDSDGDGISDSSEGGIDTDGDGEYDFEDTDSDGDGMSDLLEHNVTLVTGNELLTLADADGDGLPNWKDLDSDNDGWTDAEELYNNSNTNTDTGFLPAFLDPLVPGMKDSCVSRCAETDSAAGSINIKESNVTIRRQSLSDDKDTDSDGISDLVEGSGDTDGDGISDYMDMDSDNDGILDAIEGADDSDGDGLPNYLDLVSLLCLSCVVPVW
jgi:hypothetical protein